MLTRGQQLDAPLRAKDSLCEMLKLAGVYVALNTTLRVLPGAPVIAVGSNSLNTYYEASRSALGAARRMVVWFSG